MLKAIKRLFSREETPMVRWNPERLAEIKDYLETKPTDEFTEDDWNLVIEWLGQRYFPEDAEMTEERWQQRLAEFREKIASRIKNPEAPRERAPGVVESAGDPEFTKWMQEQLAKPER